MRRLLVLALLIHFGASRAFPAEVIENDDWYKNDTTGKLKETIAAFRENYLRIRQSRYAFVCKGESMRIRDGRVAQTDIYFVGYRENPRTLFYANSRTVESSSANGLRQSWDQQLLHDGKLHRRWGPLDGDVRSTLSDADEIKKEQGYFVKFCPVGMSVSTAGRAFALGPSKDAHAWLTTSRLVECKFNDDGDLVQILEQRESKSPVRATITWNRKHRFMPGRVTLDLIQQRRGKESDRRFSTVVTLWNKEANLMVPSRMIISPRRWANNDQQIAIDVRYKFDSDLPKKPLIDVASDDWREPLRIVFDETWERRSALSPLFHPQEKD